MSAKSKGTDAERELIHLFWAAGWGSIRVAGSGSIKYPAPDVIAGNGIRRLVIECKYIGEQQVYLTKKEVGELKIFSQKLAAEPWIGVRFKNNKWIFIGLEELEETPKSFVVSKKTSNLRGLSFDELTQR
ncbi:MAG: Holliday junction resolvase Hjc [Nanoarchaeota archaeon]